MALRARDGFPRAEVLPRDADRRACPPIVWLRWMGCEVAGHNCRSHTVGRPESSPNDEGEIARLTTLADA